LSRAHTADSISHKEGVIWARRITTNPSRDSLPLSNFRKKKKRKTKKQRKVNREKNKTKKATNDKQE